MPRHSRPHIALAHPPLARHPRNLKFRSCRRNIRIQSRSRGFFACSFVTSPFTRVIKAAFVGPKFDAPPLDASGSYPAAPAADGREGKYPAEVKGCPIKLDPTNFPPT